MWNLIRREQEDVRQHRDSEGGDATGTEGISPGEDPNAAFPGRVTHHHPSLPMPARSPSGHAPSFHHKRQSRTPSITASPGLRPTSTRADSGDWNLMSRDEVAQLQAERVSLARDNQMLKRRIQELGEPTKALPSLLLSPPSL